MNELPLDLIRGSNSLADLAGRIVEAHAKADGAMRSAVANAVIAGELLIEAKRQVPHGKWLPWLRSTCGLSERTAQAYMRLARKLPELEPAKAQRVADLSLREATKAIAAPPKLPTIPEPPPPVSPIELDRPLHPACALLPMVSNEELGAMVASIRKHGLFYPITIDKDGAVVDGKIRLMACKIAGVEPRFEVLPDDQDPLDFIYSTNICRKNLTASQIAAATAMELLSCPEGSTPPTTVINRLLVETAVFVLHHAPHLFDAIRDGVMTLDGAKRTVSADLEKRASDARSMTALQAEAPDLWSLVHEERMSLDEAVAEADQRAERRLIAGKLDATGDLLKALAADAANA